MSHCDVSATTTKVQARRDNRDDGESSHLWRERAVPCQCCKQKTDLCDGSHRHRKTKRSDRALPGAVRRPVGVSEGVCHPLALSVEPAHFSHFSAEADGVHCRHRQAVHQIFSQNWFASSRDLPHGLQACPISMCPLWPADFPMGWLWAEVLLAHEEPSAS